MLGQIWTTLCQNSISLCQMHISFFLTQQVCFQMPIIVYWVSVYASYYSIEYDYIPKCHPIFSAEHPLEHLFQHQPSIRLSIKASLRVYVYPQTEHGIRWSINRVSVGSLILLRICGASIVVANALFMHNVCPTEACPLHVSRISFA